MKEELLKELDKAFEETKDYTRFVDLFGDKSKSVLTRLNKTINSISLLLKMNDVKDVLHPTIPALINKTGCLVKIRPCAAEYQNKTYLGFYIGDIAHGSSLGLDGDKIQVEFTGHNPAIFVPELGKVIYGFESWWSKIKSEKDLASITDGDIKNVWYIKLLEEIGKKESKK